MPFSKILPGLPWFTGLVIIIILLIMVCATIFVIYAWNKKVRLCKQLSDELENRVHERTIQLETLNRDLESFSYSVSHDLRAPLRSIIGFSKILKEEYNSKLDEEGNRLCDIISTSARQMDELINELLCFAKIGRSSLDLVSVEMKTLASTSFEELTTEAERKNSSFELDNIQNIYGDKILLKLVWNNLISNAIKFASKNKTSKIEIRSTADNNMITYSVRDNGVGFDNQYGHKLFTIFQRLHSQSEFEGNGVGLAIVHKIVSKHNGKVWAEGEVGKGSIFYFSLPVAK